MAFDAVAMLPSRVPWTGNQPKLRVFSESNRALVKKLALKMKIGCA